jgi:hypothetical protein
VSVVEVGQRGAAGKIARMGCRRRGSERRGEGGQEGPQGRVQVGGHPCRALGHDPWPGVWMASVTGQQVQAASSARGSARGATGPPEAVAPHKRALRLDTRLCMRVRSALHGRRRGCRTSGAPSLSPCRRSSASWPLNTSVSASCRPPATASRSRRGAAAASAPAPAPAARAAARSSDGRARWLWAGRGGQGEVVRNDIRPIQHKCASVNLVVWHSLRSQAIADCSNGHGCHRGALQRRWQSPARCREAVGANELSWHPPMECLCVCACVRAHAHTHTRLRARTHAHTHTHTHTHTLACAHPPRHQRLHVCQPLPFPLREERGVRTTTH